MADTPITILGEPLERTIRFDIPLTPPRADLITFPWLRLVDGQNRLRERHYTVERELAPGGFSIAILADPSDSEGVLHPQGSRVVIKLPNLKPEGRLASEIEGRARLIKEHSFEEWEIARNKLRDCKYANPVFDLGDVWLGRPLRSYIVSAQLYLHDALPLNEWLRARGFRGPLRRDAARREIPDHWDGIADGREWLRIATMIAEALTDVHQRRVVHGDIWPPNVFVRDQDGADPHVVFIDFGESFGFVPDGNPRTQNDHPYRAPERAGSEYVATEQVDVYSFGMLLLYLATGREVPITETRSGYARRCTVRELLSHNRVMAQENPRACDIIMRAIAVDPARRPTISEIYRDLKDAALPRPRPQVQVAAVRRKLAGIGRKLKTTFGGEANVFTSLIDERLAEIEELIEGCGSGVVHIAGTRNQLLQVMQRLFDEMRAGDSWTGITTPSVWQGAALGLDGRYFTATVEAVRRGAAVHRCYAFSIEELGADWSRQFAHRLEDSGDGVLAALAEAMTVEIEKCKHQCELRRLRHVRPSGPADHAPPPHGHSTARLADPDEAFYHEHRLELERVVRMLGAAVGTFGLGSQVAPEFTTIRDTRGLYVGVLPVATLSGVRELRAANPMSLMYTSAAVAEEDRWTLVMTDILGRNQAGTAGGLRPQLRRVRVFRSVQGVPRERIINLERLLSGPAFNVGPRLVALGSCLPTV